MSKSAPPPVPPAPAGKDDFARFDRTVGDALSQIVESPPSGPVPPLKTPLGPADATVAPQPHTAPPAANTAQTQEDQALEAYRAMLRAEEKRLESLPKPPPMVTGPVGGYVPSAFGASQQELVVREGADPLHIESFKLLRRLVASGSALLTLVDYESFTRHLTKLKEAIEPKPPVVTP